MINKLTKLQTILGVVLATLLGDIFILSWLPKIIRSISVGLKYEINTTGLMTIFVVGSAVRLIGVFFCVLFIIKTNIPKSFNYKITLKYILISWMFLIYIVVNIEYVNITQDKIPLVIALVLSSLIIGLYEEVLFRGVILSLLLKKWGANRKQVYFAVVFGSLLFGLFHLGNITSVESIIPVLTQVVYSTIMGIAFSAIFLRTNKNLLWCVILHGLYDLASGFGDLAPATTTESATAAINILPYISNMLLFIPLLVYGLLLLKKVKGVASNGTVEI